MNKISIYFRFPNGKLITNQINVSSSYKADKNNLFEFKYQIRCCLKRKGLNDSGNQNAPLAKKLKAKFRLLASTFELILPKIA